MCMDLQIQSLAVIRDQLVHRWDLKSMEYNILTATQNHRFVIN